VRGSGVLTYGAYPVTLHAGGDSIAGTWCFVLGVMDPQTWEVTMTGSFLADEVQYEWL
jgi:hypothetical protein